MIVRWLFLLAFLSAHATISLSPVTPRPSVFANDTPSAHGPWFMTAYAVSSDLDITLIGVEHSVRATNGQNVSYFEPFLPPLVVEAHQLVITPAVYVGCLPDQINFVFDVEARIIGWYGLPNQVGEILSAVTLLQTQ